MLFRRREDEKPNSRIVVIFIKFDDISSFDYRDENRDPYNCFYFCDED